MRLQLPRSSFSLILWQMFRLYNYFTDNASWSCGLWQTMTFKEGSELFQKYPKTPVFDHSNYRLFERIHAVPGTSNNRGLTVCALRGYFAQTKVLKTNGSLMKVPWNILQYIWPSIMLPWSILHYFYPSISNIQSWKTIFGLFLEWPNIGKMTAGGGI